MTKVMLVCSLSALAERTGHGQHGGMFTHYTPAHVANILCHIVAGILAMVAGLVAIVASKRGRLHARAGMVFVYTYSVVILTAVLGVIVFEFRSFLAVATIASSYSLFSGFRATRLRGLRPAPLDRTVAAVGLTAPVLFITAMRTLHQPWNPVLTWTVLGGLIASSSYDLLRMRLPAAWLHRIWVNEHLIKMIGAFDALTATFAATVLPQFQPWSAIIPNLVGLFLMRTFVLRGARAWGTPAPSQSEGESLIHSA